MSSAALPVGASASAVDQRRYPFRQEIARRGLDVAGQPGAARCGARGSSAAYRVGCAVDEGFGAGRPAPAGAADGVSAFPLARLYEHPNACARSSSSRTWQGVQALFFEQITAPEQ
jgi:hypothetical protein